jgi:hypothetical protein
VQPWNVALWAAFARLRFAIEADCDGRVLAARIDVRRYGRLLLKVLELTPRAPPRRPALPSLAAAAAAAALLLIAVVIPLPAQAGTARPSAAPIRTRVDTARPSPAPVMARVDTLRPSPAPVMAKVDTAWGPTPQKCKADGTTPVVSAGCAVPHAESRLFRGISLSRTQQDSSNAIDRHFLALHNRLNAQLLPVELHNDLVMELRAWQIAQKRALMTPAQLPRFEENAEALRRADERLIGHPVIR